MKEPNGYVSVDFTYTDEFENTTYVSKKVGHDYMGCLLYTSRLQMEIVKNIVIVLLMLHLITMFVRGIVPGIIYT